MILKYMQVIDTARSGMAGSIRKREANEEIYGFNIGLSLETSVNELRHPQPLPKGKFMIRDLYAAFRHYPHAFHDFGAELTIGDTTLLLRNFAGKIDSSDLLFSGRVNNYALWFDKVMKGRTQIAFDLKSQRLAMNDLLGKYSRQYVPKDYHHEIASNLWLRSKIDLEYDTVFRFANIKIANISGELQQHAFRVDSLSGNVKIGADQYVKIDTLKGKIANSDFDISLRLSAAKDTVRRKKANYLRFSSPLLDVDQLTNYPLTAEDEATPDTSAVARTSPLTTPAKPSSHAQAFNIFQIPVIDFRATVDIGRIKYRRLGV